MQGKTTLQNPDHVLSVNDVYNVVAEHMNALDTLWPDGDNPPRKVHVVELIDGIKLKLAATAEKNVNRYKSPFEAAAERVMGKPHFSQSEGSINTPTANLGKTAMQIAHEAAQARMKRG